MIYDGHVHYTGALPEDYLKLMGYMDKYNYTDDCCKNIDAFFRQYQDIQKLTKPESNLSEHYKERVAGICAYMRKSHVFGFNLISGMDTDIDRLKSRILGTIAGFQATSYKAKITLCFIKEANGRIKNLDGNILAKLDAWLAVTLDVIPYIHGFDICGYETVKTESIQDTCDLIKDLTFFRNKYGFLLSSHAGELFVLYDPADILQMFEKLLPLHLDSIGHGTFLWIPDEFLNISPDINKLRKRLLQEFIKRHTLFEICPTGNALLSPLKCPENISRQYLKKLGLRYSINSDNPTIFKTHARREAGLLSP